MLQRMLGGCEVASGAIYGGLALRSICKGVRKSCWCLFCLSSSHEDVKRVEPSLLRGEALM